MKQEALNYLLTIPEWKVTTYKNIWVIFWVHPRSIAQILKHNKSPEIYPCYKVISATWKLSWYNLWIEQKIKKLNIDWVEVKNLKINKKFII